MKKFILLLFFALLLSAKAFAHQTFTLVSSEKKTLKEADLAQIEKNQTFGKKEKTNLIFTEKEIRLVAVTGPEDDMLSYRIQGLRSPNLIVPSGATLKILFVNSDSDMRHDIRFGHLPGEFTLAPDVSETAGSEKLPPRAADGMIQAAEITIKASEDGAYKYFCSVRGHAKGGMWGNILVGIKSTENLKNPEKTTHVHSADEDKEHPPADESKPHSHDQKMDVKKPDDKQTTKKPSEEKSEMPMNHADHDAEKMENMAGMSHGEQTKCRCVRPLISAIR